MYSLEGPWHSGSWEAIINSRTSNNNRSCLQNTLQQRPPAGSLYPNLAYRCVTWAMKQCSTFHSANIRKPENTKISEFCLLFKSDIWAFSDLRCHRQESRVKYQLTLSNEYILHIANSSSFTHTHTDVVLISLNHRPYIVILTWGQVTL